MSTAAVLCRGVQVVAGGIGNHQYVCPLCLKTFTLKTTRRRET